MGIGTWIKTTLFGPDFINPPEGIERQGVNEQRIRETSLRNRAGQQAEADARAQALAVQEFDRRQPSTSRGKYPGTRAPRGKCVCGCWGQSLSDLPKGTVDYYLYGGCPARRARKIKETEVKKAKRAKQKDKTKKRKKIEKAEARKRAQRQKLEVWNARDREQEPAQSAAEARHRELKIYMDKICKEGHSGERYTRNGECVECKLHDSRLRDAMRRGAYPRDLTQADRKSISSIYKQARKLTRETGIEHHVDHIKPLAAGGVHHPDNLQILTAEENLKKGANWKVTTTYRGAGVGRKDSF